MNFTITWVMDRLGFVPKASVDFQEWPFPVKKTAAKKVAKKTVKIPKATTRKTSTKK